MSHVWSRLLYPLMGLMALIAASWLVIGPEPPTPLNLALFLVLLVPAVAGLATPLLSWIHGRLPIGGSPPSAAAAPRQAFLLGLAVALAGWLQLIRLLDGTLLLGIAALVILTEVLAQSQSG